jgi:hypothetical protein
MGAQALDRGPGEGADRDHDHDRHQRRHRDDRDEIAEHHHQDQQQHAGTKVDSRPRPPDFTLMIDWPIMAQPAMPPMKPVAVLAMPWPTHSWLRFDVVSVRSSTMVLGHQRFQAGPTAATATE